MTKTNKMMEKNPMRITITSECETLKKTLLNKNANYGNSALESPFFTDFVSPEIAIMVRMSDKVARLKRLFSGEVDKVGESIQDTLLDLAGYCILARIAIDRSLQEFCSEDRPEEKIEEEAEPEPEAVSESESETKKDEWCEFSRFANRTFRIFDDFCDEAIEVGVGNKVRFSTLYFFYCRYCRKMKLPERFGYERFGREIMDRFPTSRIELDGNGFFYHTGLSLKFGWMKKAETEGE